MVHYADDNANEDVGNNDDAFGNDDDNNDVDNDFFSARSHFV